MCLQEQPRGGASTPESLPRVLPWVLPEAFREGLGCSFIVIIPREALSPSLPLNS